MSLVRFAQGACLLAVVTGCGGAKPEPVAPPPPAASEATAAPAEKAAPLSPVSAPPELFAVGRVGNPAKLFDTAIAWSGLPVNWRALLEKAAPGLPQIGALEAPIDAAAMLDPTSGETPRVLWAFAFGVASTDAAAQSFRQQGFRVSAERGGVFSIDNGSLRCLDVPALGAAAARVVCSDRAEGVDALATYLARGLPTESFGASEVHIHVSAEPFRRRYGAQLALVRTVGVPFALRELSLDHPRFDRALRDALYGAADDLIALAYDLDRLDLDLTLTPERDAVDLGTTLVLSGQRSFWGQEMARAAGQGGPPMDAFWKLPGKSTAATYGAYADPDHVRGIALALRDLLDGWLDYQGLPESRRAPLVSAFEESLTTGAKSAHASFPAELPAGSDPRSRRESVRASIGTQLLVVDRGGDKLARLVSEVGKALSDRSFRDHLVKNKLLSADAIPVLRERAPKGAKGLTPGTKAFELTIPAALADMSEPASAAAGKTPVAGKKPKAAMPGESLSFVLLVVPDGELTWFGFGGDEKAISARLAEARAGSGEALATREGLAPLRAETALSAGFTSLASLISGAQAPFGADLPIGDAKAMDQLPYRGQTPVLWHARTDAQGPRATLSARVPRAVVQDIVALTASQVARLPHR